MRDFFPVICGPFAEGVTVAGRSTAGRRMMNSLPFPGPSLFAAMLPSCISTSFLTIVSPMPSPPSDRAEERSPCVKSSNIAGNFSGGMPMPVSFTLMTISPPSRCGGEPDLPAVVAVLDGVDEQIDDDLLEAGGIGVDPEVPPVHRDVQRVFPLVGDCLDRLDGTFQDRGRVDHFAAKFDLAEVDSRDVEQVVDQPHQVLGLPPDDV